MTSCESLVGISASLLTLKATEPADLSVGIVMARAPAWARRAAVRASTASNFAQLPTPPRPEAFWPVLKLRFGLFLESESCLIKGLCLSASRDGDGSLAGPWRSRVSCRMNGLLASGGDDSVIGDVGCGF